MIFSRYFLFREKNSVFNENIHLKGEKIMNGTVKIIGGLLLATAGTVMSTVGGAIAKPEIIKKVAEVMVKAATDVVVKQ